MELSVTKLQNVLFIQTATERELDALRDLVNWLIFDDLKGCKNIAVDIGNRKKAIKNRIDEKIKGVDSSNDFDTNSNVPPHINVVATRPKTAK